MPTRVKASGVPGINPMDYGRNPWLWDGWDGVGGLMMPGSAGDCPAGLG